MRLIGLVVVLALNLILAPLAAEAQTAGKVYRIGFLGAASARQYSAQVDAMRRGLRDLGYVEGRNLTIDYRWADGRYERLDPLAVELVRLKVDVIVTHGTPGSPGSEAGDYDYPDCHGRGGQSGGDRAGPEPRPPRRQHHRIVVHVRRGERQARPGAQGCRLACAGCGAV